MMNSLEGGSLPGSHSGTFQLSRILTAAQCGIGELVLRLFFTVRSRIPLNRSKA